MEARLTEFTEFLLAQRALQAEQLAGARRLVDETDESLPLALVKLGFLSEQMLSRHLAEFLHIERLELADDAMAVVPDGVAPAFLRQHRLALLERAGGLTAVTADPLDSYPVNALRFATGLDIATTVATASSVEALLDQCAPAPAKYRDGTDGLESSHLDSLRDLASEAPIVRLVQRLISDAVDRKASDIHFEPTAAGLQVRFRIDGMLVEAATLESSLRAPMVSRLKIQAHLNIAEQRLPQDGRLRLTVQGKDTDFRVATSPTVHGETVVLRILDRQEVALEFDALGLDATAISTMRQALARPYGIVLSTGPTGSGKTTTLYAALRELNTRDRKILTVEDPVEYTLEGIQQSQVKPAIGYTFAQALRSFLRQDPDVMMVGEIRDRETAEVAIQAALTGHLLLSTLHTNSAAAAVTRLLDMGIDDYLLTSTLNLLIGQRLVRKLCVDCRSPRTVGAERLRPLGIEVTADTRMLYQPNGCERCHGTGYCGRTSLIELLELSEPIQKLILARADATTLENAAREAGMRTMFECGLELAMSGATTLEEVLRVTRLSPT